MVYLFMNYQSVIQICNTTLLQNISQIREQLYDGLILQNIL
jgi:hypothetical protein